MSAFARLLRGLQRRRNIQVHSNRGIPTHKLRMESLEDRRMLSLSSLIDFGIDPSTLPVHPDVTTFDAPANHVVGTGTALDGVVELIIDGQFLCTGTLLPTRNHILTAAHCIDGATSVDVRFHLAGGVQTVTVQADNLFLHPNFDHVASHGSDIGIIELDADAPAGVASFDIRRAPLAGISVVDVVGYGVAGQGIEQFLDGNKRQGQNRYEIFFDAGQTMIMYDFDDGTAAHDAIGIGTGGTGANTGLGNNEVLGVGGDSGSPTFLGGQIAGVHSFRTTLAGGTGDAVAGLNGSFGELSVDMLTSAHSAFIDDIIIDQAGAPTITNVIVSGSNSTHTPYSFDTVDGSGLQLKTVPVGGADIVSVQFSDHVMNIDGDSLILTGLTTGVVPQLATDGFSYDVSTHTATWTFDAPFDADQYLLSLADSITDVAENALDGEWTNPFSVTTINALVSEFPSGNGTAGGDFNFAFTILPGDADLTNFVNGRDFLNYQRNPGGPGHTFTQSDYDGDGDTDSADLAFWQANYGTNLIDLVFADFNGDGVINSLDEDIWDTNQGTGTTHAQGDADTDGDVDATDLAILQMQLGLQLKWVA